jgi:hypothetical protein
VSKQFALLAALLCLLAPACTSPASQSEKDYIALEIRKYMKFHWSINSKRPAKIDFRKLEEAYPNSILCFSEGYGFQTPTQAVIDDRYLDYLNEYPYSQSRNFVLITRDRAFVYQFFDNSSYDNFRIFKNEKDRYCVETARYNIEFDGNQFSIYQ